MSNKSKTPTVEEARDRLETRMWELHKRLGEAYESKAEQLQDAIQLGELAKHILKLQEANNIMFRLDTIITGGKS